MRRLVMACLAAFVSSPAVALATTPFFTQSFDATTTASDPSYPGQIADLNGDGIPDLCGLELGGTTFEVRFGGPGRTYGPSVTGTFVTWVGRFCLGDFDADGDLDVAGVNAGGGVELLPYLGNGSFGAATTLPVAGYFARDLAVGDLDDDGRDDLVVMATTENSAGMLLTYRATAGGFAAPSIRATSAVLDVRYDLVVADVDGDARLDVVFTGASDDGIAAHRGAGDGTLLAPFTIPGVKFVNDLEVADLNGDGHADLVLGLEAGTETLRRCLGHGDGTFDSPQTMWTGSAVEAVGIGDVDGGGDADVAFVTNTLGTLVLRGEVGFSLTQVLTVIDAGPSRPLRLGDFDGDGRTDIFIGQSHGIYWGDGNGSPGAWAGSHEVTGQLENVELLDVSGDRVPDLLTRTSTCALVVERSRGDGTFDPPVTIVGAAASDAAFGDVTGDGSPDAVLVVPSGGNLVLRVVSGTGDGSFFSGTVDTPVLGAASVNGMVTGDLDLDGNDELVVCGAGPGVTGPGPPFLRVYRGAANGSLVLVDAVFEDLRTPSLSDVNGDGWLDVIGRNGPGFEIRLGNGTGSLGSPSTLAAPAGPDAYQFAIGTVDAGATLDVLAIGYDGSPWLASGNGDGTFQAFAPIPGFPSTGVRTVTLADLDRDGDNDLILATPTAGNPGTLRVALNDGAGGFPETFALGTGAVSTIPVRVADLNADGKPDLVNMGYSVFYRTTIHLNTLANTIAVPRAPSASGLALSVPSPQRGSGGLAVRFMLPDGAAARLELFDVSGRRFDRIEVGHLGGGLHDATLGREGVPAGLYLVRLSREGRAVTQKLTIRP